MVVQDVTRVVVVDVYVKKDGNILNFGPFVSIFHFRIIIYVCLLYLNQD